MIINTNNTTDNRRDAMMTSPRLGIKIHNSDTNGYKFSTLLFFYGIGGKQLQVLTSLVILSVGGCQCRPGLTNGFNKTVMKIKVITLPRHAK